MNQLKAGAALNYIIIVLSTLVGLLYTPYMLRMMGQSEYGLYSLVSSVISYLTILDLGFGNAIVRYTAKYRAEGKIKEQYDMFGMFLLLYIVVGLISLVAGGLLYLNVDNMFGDTMTKAELAKAKIMMLILIFNLAFTFPMSIFGSIITAYERFIFPKMISIIRIILNTGVMIALLSMGYRAVTMVIVQTVFNVLTLIINYIYCKNKLHIEIHFGRFQWGFLKEVAIYSFWIFLNIIMDKIYWSTGQFVLGVVSGTVAIAVFAVAIQLQSMYMQFSTAISSVFFPMVTGMVAKNATDKELSDLFIRTGRVQNIVMSLVLFGFIVFGKPFIILWAGSDYEGAYLMTVFFFISLYAPLIQNLGISILQAKNQMKFRSLLYLIIATAALVLQFVLAKVWSGLGCAIAISGALILGQGIIMNIYYCKKQKIDILSFWREILKMDFAPIILTCIFYFIVKSVFISSWLQLIEWVVVFVCIYLPIVYFFSMNSYEKDLIAKPLLKLIKK